MSTEFSCWKGMPFSRSSSRSRNYSGSCSLSGSALLERDSSLLGLSGAETYCLNSISAVILRVRIVNSGMCCSRSQAETFRRGRYPPPLPLRKLWIISKGADSLPSASIPQQIILIARTTLKACTAPPSPIHPLPHCISNLYQNSVDSILISVFRWSSRAAAGLIKETI
jgi:hypothetical protein